jgi:hypothetical protein
MPAWLVALFEAIKGAMQLATKAIPDDKIREQNQNLRLPRLTLRERDKILEECRLWLSVRPKIDIDTYVNYKCVSLNPTDIDEIKTMLHEMFPKRELRTLKFEKK